MPAAEEHPTDWYVLRGRERGGPYPYSLVREGAKGGLISMYDLVWRPGWEDWLDAGGVDGLFPASEIERDTQSPKRDDAPGRRPPAANALPYIPANFVFEAPPEEPDQVSSNYIMGHWRGEFSLPAAFLGNGLVVGLVLVIAASAFYTVLEQNKVSVIQFAVMIVALLIVYLASITWLLVGTWRSALRHRSRGGLRAWLTHVNSRVHGASRAKPN
jgi:uncharacterized protein DUF4339